MDFSKVKSLTIPEGNVVKIMSGDVVLWTKPKEPANSGKQRREKAQLNLARPFPVFKPFRDLRESLVVFGYHEVFWIFNTLNYLDQGTKGIPSISYIE